MVLICFLIVGVHSPCYLRLICHNSCFYVLMTRVLHIPWHVMSTPNDIDSSLYTNMSWHCDFNISLHVRPAPRRFINVGPCGLASHRWCLACGHHPWEAAWKAVTRRGRILGCAAGTKAPAVAVGIPSQLWARWPSGGGAGGQSLGWRPWGPVLWRRFPGGGHCCRTIAHWATRVPLCENSRVHPEPPLRSVGVRVASLGIKRMVLGSPKQS